MAHGPNPAMPINLGIIYVLLGYSDRIEYGGDMAYKNESSYYLSFKKKQSLPTSSVDQL